MVVDGDREHALGLFLPDHVLVQNVIDLFGYRQLGALPLAAGFLNFFTNNVVAQINAFVTDKHRRTRNELPYLVLAFATERAIKQLAVVARGVLVCHKVFPRIIVWPPQP